MHEMFQRAVPVLEIIEAAGFEAYFVGGAIRDYLLQRPISDVDIATSATPYELKDIFPNTIDIGIEHGTILVLFKGESYEITTFRSETGYKDFRHPEEVKFIRSLKEDLQRRDFTMNAIAMDRKGKILDPFYGQQALHERRIVTVGTADERFTEDALRMMRAVRFASQLGFQLDKDTEKALAVHASLLGNISTERITSEFRKLLKGENKKIALSIILDSGLYQQLPGLSSGSEALESCLKLNVNDCSENQMWLLLLYLLSPEKPMEFLRSWKLPSKMVKYLSETVRILKNRDLNTWSLISLYDAKEAAALDVETVYAVLRNMPPNELLPSIFESFQQMALKDRAELNVTGSDLIKWCSKPPGPWIKETLRKIEINILNQHLENQKEAIKEWLHTCSPQQESDC